MFYASRVQLAASLFFAVASAVLGQQRQNDFTKRIRAFDGKLNALSAKRISSPGLNAKFNRRMHVSQIPQRYSSFGGKRFPVGDSAVRFQKPFETQTLSFDRGFDQKSAFADKKANNVALGVREPATASVDFRDSYYEELDKRVEEWMKKVNNMSLQDVNRYQFRRGRSSEPGFPVQKAGSRDLPKPSVSKGLGISGFRGVTPPSPANPSASRPSYRMGPRRAVTSVGGSKPPSISRNPSSGASRSIVSGASSSTRKALLPSPNLRKVTPSILPRLGPKKVRVSVK